MKRTGGGDIPAELQTLPVVRPLRSRQATASMVEVMRVFILLLAVVMGADYLHTPSGLALLGWVSAAMPLSWWGWWFIIWGGCGIVGELLFAFSRWRCRWVATYVAHTALAALYAVFAVSAAMPTIKNGWGWWIPFSWIGLVLGHLLSRYLRRGAPHAATLQ